MLYRQWLVSIRHPTVKVSILVNDTPYWWYTDRGEIKKRENENENPDFFCLKVLGKVVNRD